MGIEDDVGVEFEERRKGGVTVRVVPVKYVIWTASVLFVLWNIVGFPLLDYYLTRKFAEHNKDVDAHTAILASAGDKLSRNDEAIKKQLEDVSTRLSRIEGALGIGVNGNGTGKR